MASIEEILKILETTPHPEVKVAVCDIDGVLRGKYMAKEKFASVLEKGFGFCDVVFGWDSNDRLYDNSKVTGWHTGYPDTVARPDLKTFRKIPWEEDRPFCLADFFEKEWTPLPVCPRNLLKSVVERAERKGLAPYASFEFEYFIFEETPHTLHEKKFRDLKPLSPGMFGYSILRSSAASDFVTGLVKKMKSFRCPIEGIHTETGPGVFETALIYDEAMEAADRALLFKTGLKELVGKEGKVATFMAKWNESLPGCSGHIHVSLADPDTRKNLFADDNTSSGMSDLFSHFVAGVLHSLHDFTAFYAPTINSYKRSIPGVWSPVNATWGFENRTTALRVITSKDGKGTRMEQRTTGADINPYLALAATLASGLYGIEKRLPLEKTPVRGNAYDIPLSEEPLLPRNLEGALKRLEKSDLAKELLGEAFVDHYVKTREWEVREYNKAVTDWELKRYFEII